MNWEIIDTLEIDEANQSTSTDIVFRQLWDCLKHHWESDVFYSSWKILKIYKKYSVSIFFIELFLYHFIHTKISELWIQRFSIWNIDVSFSVLPLDITNIWLVQDLNSRENYVCSNITYVLWDTLMSINNRLWLALLNWICHEISDSISNRYNLVMSDSFSLWFKQINPENVKISSFIDKWWKVELSIVVTDIAVCIKWFIFDNFSNIVQLIWDEELSKIISFIESNYNSILWVSDNLKLFQERIK